jgi:FKBP-type peptidyl-prolyl cis-trans isomerase
VSRRLRVAAAAAVALGLGVAGCGDPQVIPVAPPGVELTRLIPREEGDSSEAIGEANNMQVPQQTATPIASGEELAPTKLGEAITTKSGLKYETLRPGTGVGVKPGQQISVHYVGTFPDGRTFDSSRERGRPFDLTLGRGDVIPGWDQGIPGMKVGETRRLTIPPELGYGKKGSPPTIPPDATLVFEIELLKIQ